MRHPSGLRVQSRAGTTNGLPLRWGATIAAVSSEPITKLLTGHSRGDSLTYRHYSKGLPLEELANAIPKVTYGPADWLVRRNTGKVKVTVRSRRIPAKSKMAA